MQPENYLDKIVRRKQEEVDRLLKILALDMGHPLHATLQQQKQPTGLFAKALRQSSLTVIAEIKRKSPSKGELGAITDPVALALQYCEGGASAISVLTDEVGFGGSLRDLQLVSQAVSQSYPEVPVLRKDFIVHPVQLAEAAHHGAKCVLLIARVLKAELEIFIQQAHRLGLETLTEIHDEQDLQYALDAKAPIIGINHRNLSTFTIDLALSGALKPRIPEQVITVAESGIHTPEIAQLMRQRGYDAILVGEALVKAEQPSALIQQMKEVVYAS